MDSKEIKLESMLSIDWDYVTGDCSCEDINHCGFCLSRNCTRGSVQFLGDWKPWFDKVRKIFVPKGCPIYVAECHASIIEAIKILKITPCVYDFDHHFDRYDRNTILSCANWIHHLELMGGTVKHRSAKVPKSLKAAFFCLSSPWTPSSMDEKFFDLVKHFARKSRTRPIFIGHDREYLEYEYNQFQEVKCQVQERI